MGGGTMHSGLGQDAMSGSQERPPPWAASALRGSGCGSPSRCVPGATSAPSAAVTAPQPGGVQRPPPASRTALVVGWPRSRHRQTPCLGRTRFLVHCPPWGGGKGALGVSEMRAPVTPSWAPPSHPTTSRRPPPTPPHRKAVFLLRVRVFQADQPLRPLQEGTGPAQRGDALRSPAKPKR